MNRGRGLITASKSLHCYPFPPIDWSSFQAPATEPVDSLSPSGDSAGKLLAVHICEALETCPCNKVGSLVEPILSQRRSIMTIHRSLYLRLAPAGSLSIFLVLGAARHTIAQLVPPPIPGTFSQAPFNTRPARPSALTSQQVVERVAPAVVVILAGSGSVPVALGSGVIVRPDGIVMTAYHLIKDQPAVQVRLKNGETYDRVVVLGIDERRDVAALRIPAANLQTLSRARMEDARPGAVIRPA